MHLRCRDIQQFGSTEYRFEIKVVERMISCGFAVLEVGAGLFSLTASAFYSTTANKPVTIFTGLFAVVAVTSFVFAYSMIKDICRGYWVIRVMEQFAKIPEQPKRRR